MAIKKIKVTQIKSKNKRIKAHKACLSGLGLRRINHSVEVVDTPENRGMINTVSYLIKVGD